MRYAKGSLIAFSIFSAMLLFFSHYKQDTLSAVSHAGQPATISLATAGPASRQPPDGWREYASTRYRFSLFYPAAMKVTEFDEGAGASTITFENVSDAQGFQIFIVPYTEKQVSEVRFRRDEPSGVRNNPTDITIDGAMGVAFYSKDAALGDTREIWFIRNGFLYEATTLKSDSSLLESIMQEWKFM